MHLAKPSMITAMLVLLLFGGLSDALALPNAAKSHNITSCASLNQTHAPRSSISKRGLPSQIWQNSWTRLLPASEAQCAALAADGRAFFNEIMFQDVNGAANLMSQRLNNGQRDPLGADWQRYVGHSEFLMRATNPPIWGEWDITHAARKTFRPIQNLIAGQVVGSAGMSGWQSQHSPSTRRYPDGPNVCLRQHQSVQYHKTDEGRHVKTGGGNQHTYPPTGAGYETWFNLVDGIIINRRAIGARTAAQTQAQWGNRVPQEHELPEIYHWSELVFVGWMQSLRTPHIAAGTLGKPIDWTKISNRLVTTKAIGGAPLKQNLNYIIVQAADSPPATSSVIKTCLVSQGYGFTIPSWPDGARFHVGSWCFYALLDLPVNKGIAYLLAQHKSPSDRPHKNGLGHKVLEYVDISSGQVPDDPEWYSLVHNGRTLYRNRLTGEMTDKEPEGFEEPNLEDWKWGFSPTLIWKVASYRPDIVQRARTNEQQWSLQPLALNGLCEYQGEAAGYTGKGKGRAPYV